MKRIEGLERIEKVEVNERVEVVERCDRCGAKIENGMSRRIDGENLCVECFFEVYVPCICCSDMIRREDAVYLESICGHVCKECFKNNIVRCDICGELVPKDAIEGYDNEGRAVCVLCSGANYVRCEYCGELIRHEEAVWVDSHNYYICESCFEYSDLVICESCNGIFEVEDTQLTSEGYICFNCLNEEVDVQIYDYSYKPKWRFYAIGSENHGTGDRIGTGNGIETRSGIENKDLIYLGVELEVDVNNWSIPSDMKIRAVEMTKEILGEHVILKSDGSLTTMGFEIVSHPCTLEYHKKMIKWKEAFEMLVELGYRSHDTDTCGLHVSIRKPNEIELAKLIIFFEKYWNEILKFSRRSESQYKRWCDRYLKDGEKIDYEKAKDIVITAKDKYRAINISKRDIVEFRIFRGTLSSKTFYATLEFVHALVMYIKSKSVEEIVNGDWQDFIDWIWENCDCEYLIDYLEEIELI